MMIKLVGFQQGEAHDFQDHYEDACNDESHKPNLYHQPAIKGDSKKELSVGGGPKTVSFLKALTLKYLLIIKNDLH